MKRTFKEAFNIDQEFIKDCDTDFNNDTANILAKNVITNVGSFHATTDYEEARKVSHVFLNSLKKKNLKATNQGASGRCWIFSGLNMFRHSVINALGLENFEFSETYLFFWDKFERSNSYLHWIEEIVSKDSAVDNNDRLFRYLIEEDSWMSDGGYWSYFANLVDKYGLVPKSAMPETFQSEYSTDMNQVLISVLHSATTQLSKLNSNDETRTSIIKETLKKIYSTLVKFLGNPPKIFKWDYTTDDGDSQSIENLTPMSFKEMVLPGINLNDFVVLSNIPSKKYKYYKKYSVNNSSNVLEGEECTTINLPINELKKYAKKSIFVGMPVWFAGDVNKGFNPVLSALNEKLNNESLLFGDKYEMNKEERIFFCNQQTCHAMTLLGVNVDNKDKPLVWQVENSWGFYDNETPGLDGFLCMSDSWFDNYLGQIVVHKNLLSRNIKKLVDKEPIRIEPWESLAPALFVNSKLIKKV
jgi:bleomycin hydrolase